MGMDGRGPWGWGEGNGPLFGIAPESAIPILMGGWSPQDSLEKCHHRKSVGWVWGRPRTPEVPQ